VDATNPASILDRLGEVALLAVVYDPPLDERARWTVRLLARDAEGRGILDSVGRAPVCVVLPGIRPTRDVF